MITVEPVTAATLARRAAPPQWRGFLRALVETLDEHVDAEGRAALMHAIGVRMAAALPLPYCDTLSGLEGCINDALSAADWGYCRLALDTQSPRLVVTHGAAPAVAAGADEEGAWAGAVLEGLYTTWFAAQPGADPTVPLKLTSWAPGKAVLEYGRE
jgi:hypothetical protein